MTDPAGPSLSTERLLLRRWQRSDLEPFAALNADPEVMEHFPVTLSRLESDALVDRIESSFAELDYGLWALEVRASGAFVGFTGLALQTFPAPFSPAVEWGGGWPGRPGGTAARRRRRGRRWRFGFDTLGLEEIVSMTAATNLRSQRVMERIGMTRRVEDDFVHPKVPEGSPVQPHVLYRIRRDGRSGERRGSADAAPTWWPWIRRT